ncbi:MAG: hypothetical protein MJY75_07635 [Bacteroidaceae bacterium]|nr:hypothetical protein [Bacteroidaceae bacterium]
MNRKLFKLTSLLFLTAVLFAGCHKDDEFDEALLTGTWYNQTEALYFNFNSDHSGRTDEDGEGTNAKQFTWSLNDDELSISYQSQSGFLDGLTEVYIVKELTSARMEAYQIDEPDVTVIFEKR